MDYSTYDQIFHDYLVIGAKLDGPWQIPTIFPTNSVPNRLIPFDKAIRSTDYDQWIHFYIHDYQFRRIIRNPARYLSVLSRFRGIISPDVSVFWNEPLYRQLRSISESREIGSWAQRNGIDVIANYRWGKPETYDFAFSGSQQGGTAAVGTIGCCQNPEIRDVFQNGLKELIRRIRPDCLVVCGEVRPDVFSCVYDAGIEVIPFETPTAEAHRNSRKEK